MIEFKLALQKYERSTFNVNEWETKWNVTPELSEYFRKHRGSDFLFDPNHEKHGEFIFLIEPSE